MALGQILMGLVLPVVTASSLVTRKADLCSLVNAQFPDKIGFPNSTTYINNQNSYYIEQERDVVPNCVFRPTSTSDVADFVKLAIANDPCSHNCTTNKPLFAVRGGGHMMWTGAANAQDGVTVDMRNMTSFALSDDLQVASIGAGSDFSDVYPLLVPHNLTIVGARVPGVAAGGFIAGGGKSFLSRRHGFACDNVFGYEVVLATGEVVYASAGENHDLWLALKGGSNNFGIITRYDLATYPLAGMWGGTQLLNYTSEVLAAEAQAFSEFMRPENLDDAADVGVLLGFVNGSFFIENTMFYSDDVANPPIFDNFTSISGVETKSLSLTTVAEIVDEDGSVVPTTIPRCFELVYSFANADPETYTQIIQSWQDGITAIDGLDGLQIQFLLQPMPVTNGTNSLGLPVHDTNLAMSVLTAAWDNVADDDKVTAALTSIVNEHETLLSSEGLLIGFKYLNYADISQNPIATYGNASLGRLWETSSKYDPTGFWQTRVPGFKLPKTAIY